MININKLKLVLSIYRKVEQDYRCSSENIEAGNHVNRRILGGGSDYETVPT